MNTIVTGALGATEADLDALRALGLEITLHPDERQPAAHPEQYEAAICNGLFLYNQIASFSNLKYIQLTSAGLDRVPMDYIRAHGIQIHNAQGVYRIPMAELALWGVLELYKQGRFFAENQRQHRWEKHRGLLELSGKTVCIVGCGSVGSECARRFAAFGCRVLGIATKRRSQPFFESVLPLEALGDTLPKADIVVLTLPLTQTTRGLFSDAVFAQMKAGSILVNLARGPIVDQNALLRALETRLGGAVLDVFDTEPLPPDSPLWNLNNTIITPHNSFVGEGNHERMMETVLQTFTSWRPK